MKLSNIVVVWIWAILHGTIGLYVHPKTLTERHSIVKRMAEADNIFTEHDVAMVLHEKEPNSFHRISKRDLRQVTDDHSTQRLRLELSSGSTIHLNLQKRSLFAPDTIFLDNTHDGLVKRSTPPQDCYATGDVESDGRSGGFASLATCNGLHGTAFVDDVEYYIHPVDHIDGDHQVHVLSRRASDVQAINDTLVNDGIPIPEDSFERYKRSTVTDETNKTDRKLIIEMAVIVDEAYFKNLNIIVPGREDEYTLIDFAGASALYSNRDKVGYDVSFKVKRYENWKRNPDGYTMDDKSLGRTLSSFCYYLKEKIKYDVHFQFTGVSKDIIAAGMGYVKGVCKKGFNCGNTSNLKNKITTIAHEIGHLLGMEHEHTNPEKCKDSIGSFMGGINRYNFSPCIKNYMDTLFKSGGQCVFKENKKTTTSDKYVNLPLALPGQYQNPDENCELIYGDDYRLFRPFDFTGDKECAVWMCINTNKDSSEFLKIQRQYARLGYTCDNEMFCNYSEICQSWDDPNHGLSVSRLREKKQDHSWSEWSAEWSPCSHSCGKGVQTKRRRCLFSTGLFLSPHCRGSPVQARLCNEDPCPGTAISVDDQRKAAGKKVCQTFHEDNTAKEFEILEREKGILESTTCLVKCVGSKPLDSLYPDGTNCTDSGSDKSQYMRQRYNIDLKCVQGACLEISDCPGNEIKDACGVCGGAPTRCVDKKFQDELENSAPGHLMILETLPAGTRSIDISMKNSEFYIALKTEEDEMIFGGPGANFTRVIINENNPASFANTTWTYDIREYIRSDGPIDQNLIVIGRRQLDSFTEVRITYLSPETQ